MNLCKKMDQTPWVYQLIHISLQIPLLSKPSFTRLEIKTHNLSLRLLSNSPSYFNWRKQPVEKSVYSDECFLAFHHSLLA